MFCRHSYLRVKFNDVRICTIYLLRGTYESYTSIVLSNDVSFFTVLPECFNELGIFRKGNSIAYKRQSTIVSFH